MTTDHPPSTPGPASRAQPSGLRYGYVTNGLLQHRLDDALAWLSDLGYDGVALTLGPPHLDPAAPGLAALVTRLATRLDDLGLAVAVETGAGYALDSRRKHEPTLLSTEGRDRRVAYLRRAVEVGADLGAEAVSFWSGRAPEGASRDEAWRRLVAGCATVVAEAERRGAVLGFEPEPGMLVDRLDGYDALAAALGTPACLGLTLDVGHCVCVEPAPVAGCVARAAPRLVHVHLDDMRRGVHEHLDFGEGELDVPAALAALRAAGYRGLASVELSRHSHAAEVVVPGALQFLQAAEQNGLTARAAGPPRRQAPAPVLAAGPVLAPGNAPDTTVDGGADTTVDDAASPVVEVAVR